MNYKKPCLVAEIGCNHMGDMQLAIKMIDIAKSFCEIKIVKFQKRENKELLSKKEYNSTHPNPKNSYGESYGLHREYLEFDVEQHMELKNYCDTNNMEYSTSVWDKTSALKISKLNPNHVKIPSACNLDLELVNILYNEMGSTVHISLGMTKKDEEIKIVEHLIKNNYHKRTVLYACTSGYPVNDEDICLLEIIRLKKNYGEDVNSIGFSGHHLGIAVDVAAYTLGAEWIERHYTLDRTMKGTDHAASIEPQGLRALQRDLISTHNALTYKKTDILEVEVEQRKKLKRKEQNV